MAGAGVVIHVAPSDRIELPLRVVSRRLRTGKIGQEQSCGAVSVSSHWPTVSASV